MSVSEKTCFKCLCKLPLEAFYKHSKMADGRLNKCKECTKKSVNDHRQNNLEKIRAYDKMRGSIPHRVKARKEYSKTDAGKLAHAKALKKQRVLHPEKSATRYAVSNAVRDGRLFKVPCRDCGSFDVEGHHPDYTKPLFVIWLCNYHHRKEHKK